MAWDFPTTSVTSVLPLCYLSGDEPLSKIAAGKRAIPVCHELELAI